MMKAQQLIEDFARKYHLDGEPDKHGHYSFTFDQLAFSCQPTGRRIIMLVAYVCPWPEQGDSAQLLANWLLRCNLARARSSREILCLDHDQNQLGLYRILRVDDCQDLDQPVESFLNTLAFWQAQVQQAVPQITPLPLLAAS